MDIRLIPNYKPVFETSTCYTDVHQLFSRIVWLTFFIHSICNLLFFPRCVCAFNISQVQQPFRLSTVAFIHYFLPTRQHCIVISTDEGYIIILYDSCPMNPFSVPSRKVHASVISLSFPAIATTYRDSGASHLDQVADHQVHAYVVGFQYLDVTQALC